MSFNDGDLHNHNYESMKQKVKEQKEDASHNAYAKKIDPDCSRHLL